MASFKLNLRRNKITSVLGGECSERVGLGLYMLAVCGEEVADDTELGRAQRAFLDVCGKKLCDLAQTGGGS